MDRARALDAQGRHDLAAENWRQVLLLDPVQPEGLSALAKYYRSIGDQTKAKHYLNQMSSAQVASSPNALTQHELPSSKNAMLQEAAHLAASHKYTDALRIFRQIFGETPSDNWALLYYQTEATIPSEAPKGIAGLRNLVERFPANPAYRLTLAEVLSYTPATRAEALRMLSDFDGTPAQNEQARSSWRKAILWDLTSHAALESAKLYLERYPDSELASKTQSSHEKNDGAEKVSAEENAAYQALQAGKLDEAQSHFTSLLKIGALSSHGDLGLGYVEMKRGDFQSALHHFEAAHSKGMHGATLERALRDARYWSAMSNGNRALKDDDIPTATTEFQLAQQIDGSRPEAAEALGDSMIAGKEPARAVDVLAADAKSNPQRTDAWTGWMNALLEAGSFDRVLAIQQEIPSNVKLELGHRPDYLAMLLCAELATGNEESARIIRERIARSNAAGGVTDGDVVAAGMLYRFGYFDDASQLSVAGLRGNNNNAQAWQILIESEHMAGRDRNALTMVSRIPPSVDESARKNPGFLLALASLYQNEGELTHARAALDRAQELSSTDTAIQTQLEMQKASLSLAQDDPASAYQMYRQIAEASPEKFDAWIGMLNALHAANRDPEALAVIDRIPEELAVKLSHDSEYLQAAGFVYSATGRSREAERCLHAVTAHYDEKHQAIPFGAGVALAWLQLDTGEEIQLARTLNQLARRRELSLSQTIALQKLWSAWSIRRAEASYTSGNTKRALGILETAVNAYPTDTPLAVELAGMYVRTGKIGLGMKIFRSMDWDNATVNQFTAGIDAAIAANSMSDAKYWLYRGLEKFPGNSGILRAGAHFEEKRGDLQEAEKYLKLAGAQVSEDPFSLANRGAGGAAIRRGAGNHDKVSSLAPDAINQPVKDRATESMGVSDNQEPLKARVDLQTSEASLQPQALSLGQTTANFQSGVYHQQDQASFIPVVALEDNSLPGARKQIDVTVDPEKSPARNVRRNRELTSMNNSDPDASSEPQAHGIMYSDDYHEPRYSQISQQASLASLMTDDKENGRSESSSSSADLEAELLGIAPIHRATVSRVDEASMGMAFEPGMERGPKATLAPNPSSELENLEARYSPWLLGGGSVESHSGTSGFDHLEHFEASMGGSTVLGTGLARISVITRPVLLQSGVPDSKSNYRFGTGSSLPTNSLFASGTSATFEIATQNIQASVGNSPSGFLVNNIVGDFTYRPHEGPFTFSAYRASEKDSLLSYAGFKDPTTGEVWGGVVATGASLLYSKGNSISGFYGSFDAQRLTGTNVKANTRVMGDVGAYWQPYFNQYGALKVGANMNIMHYSLNERYFTVGQGGYFSPNAFLLMNAPISWEGRPIYNTSYSVSASLGVESIQQAAAMPGSLITGTGAETTSGASYDFKFKIAHRMDPHWTIEGFLNANNARQYTDTSAGFTVRYATRPQSGDMTAPGFLNLFEPLPLQTP